MREPKASGAPLVSVVIPTYNAEPFIAETLESIKRQDYRPVEVVVVEDCSIDHTAEVVARLIDQLSSADFEVRMLLQPENRGGAAALSRGFRESIGEYVCWLSADDAFVGTTKLAEQVRQLGSGAALSYSRSFFTGPALGEAQSGVPTVAHWHARLVVLDSWLLRLPRARLVSLLFVNPINGSTVMIRRDQWERFGDFDPAVRNIDQDGDMWMRYSALGAQFAMLDEPVGFYRIHPGQTSSRTDECTIGTSATRIRMIMAYEEAGLLRRLLSRAWPILALAWRAGWYLQMPIVARYLCDAGMAASPSPLVTPWLSRMRDGLVSASSDELDSEARNLAAKLRDSTEFTAFVERLRAQNV